MMICLEGRAPYGHLLLAPVEGWWPSATWKTLRALWIAVKKKFNPHFFYRGPPPYAPLPLPPLPLAQSKKKIPPFLYMGPPPIPPPPPQSKKIKNKKKWRPSWILLM